MKNENMGWMYFYREVVYKRFSKDFKKMEEWILNDAAEKEIDLKNYKIIVRPEMVVIDKRKIKHE